MLVCLFAAERHSGKQAKHLIHCYSQMIISCFFISTVYLLGKYINIIGDINENAFLTAKHIKSLFVNFLFFVFWFFIFSKH